MSPALENTERFRSTLERLADDLAVEAGDPPGQFRTAGSAEETAGLLDSALQYLAWGRRRQILEALRRLHHGSYGICTGCGRPIDEERLEILPEAGFCVACQRDREAGAEARFIEGQSDEEYV